MKTSKIIKQFGTWAVTKYGVESLTTYYPIPRSRLDETENGYSWENHMMEKSWVNMDDFRSAMEFAREHFGYVRQM